jgi:hypothetical protein
MSAIASYFEQRTEPSCVFFNSMACHGYGQQKENSRAAGPALLLAVLLMPNFFVFQKDIGIRHV